MEDQNVLINEEQTNSEVSNIVETTEEKDNLKKTVLGTATKILAGVGCFVAGYVIRPIADNSISKFKKWKEEQKAKKLMQKEEEDEVNSKKKK